MMLRVAANEFRYMFWSLQSLLTFATLFGIAFLFTSNGEEFEAFAPGGAVLANSPFLITGILLRLSIAAIFVAPPYIAGALLKDVDNNYAALLFATPISKAAYLHGRFLGSFGALTLAFAGAPIGLYLGAIWPWADADVLGPNVLGHYVTVYFGMVVPTLLVVSAIVFAVVVLTRSLVFTYVISMALVLGYFMASFSEAISPLFDPFLVAVLLEKTRYWTAVELNSRLIDLPGMVLANRLLWLALAAVIYLVAYRVFSFRRPAKAPKRAATPEWTESPEVTAGFPPSPIWGRRTSARQLWLRTRFEMAAVLRSAPFVILMALSGFLLLLSLVDREVLYGVDAYPLTRLMLDGLAMLTVPMLVVLVFYSADIVWREREAGYHEVIDAVPAPNWVFVVSKVLALALVLVSITGLGVAMAIALQLLGGYRHVELGLYLEDGVVFHLLPLVLLAIMTCFFQVLARNRYFGMMLFALFMAAIVGSRDLLGWEHPLASFGLPASGAPLSDMNGYGRFRDLPYALRVYWSAIAGLMLMLTYRLWSRGTFQPLRIRLRELWRSTRSYAISAGLMLAVGLASAGFVVYNTNVLNEYYTLGDVTELQVAYEERYRQYEGLPMPRTVDVDIEVDLYPYERRVETRATQILMNKTGEELSTVHVVFPTSVEVPLVELEGAGEPRREDDPFNYYVFELDEPMRPGERRTLVYETLIQQRGFPHERPDTTLVRNGTFIRDVQITPHIGFQPEYLLDDARERERRGLPPLPRRPALEDTSQHASNPARQDADFIGFRTTVSTVADQIAVAPGYLQREWAEGGRRYFTYEMDVPIRYFFSFVSADYEVVRDRWNDIEIEVYHHPGHAYNVGRMIEAAKDSLAYYGEAFGPYQYRQLRILEFPDYRTFAQSFPNTIPYSEGIGFVADVQPGDLDVPYYVTAHEVAHQWWGHQVVAANTQGDGFIHETLAQYSALLVMEQEYGPDQIRPFLKYELDRYLSSRSGDPEGEMPLYREEDQSYVHYRKGSVVMYALRDYLGAEVVNRALRRLVELRAYRSNPYALSTDFLTLIEEEAGAEHRGLIEDLFERITLYDLELVGSRVEKMPDGRFKAILEVDAKKLYAAADGTEEEVDLDLPVDVGLFLVSPADDDFASEDVVFLEKRRLKTGRSQIEVVVDSRPAFAGVDPYNKLVDRDSDDNLGPIMN